ncbi:tRNA (adenine(22)-N(1))-methyltransferase TrmK [Carnobacterium sp.]|uniref:tRNA (adenine(22)-N(1))-methyltransferase n=1 Tax=Carnobacterium sp. TaxID=48221 RepID=UPI0028AEAFD3|nr:tRNA (adenine(22)-N(1))-methyltransferase TrmK [Carnobacterium sp.]
MNTKQLSLRLERAASYVLPDSRLADIGSDHAYLPCALAAEGTIESAIAGEVIKGPFEIAVKQVKRLGLQDKISVRLGDGLEVIDPASDQLSAITICGMGGTLIAAILDEGYQAGKLTGKERLILQPNKDEYQLRTWLIKHQYQIVAEELIEENKKLYEIIIAEKSVDQQVTASEADLIFGVHLKQERSPLFVKKWQNELKKDKQIAADLAKSATDQTEKIKVFKSKIEKIEELLK